MSNPAPYDPLIEALTGDLKPVRRLSPPATRALFWLFAVALLGAILLPFADFGSMRERFAVADLRWSYLGSALTAIAAAIAAFQSSVPGRGNRWWLLPILPALLWIGASGLGCLRSSVLPETEPTTVDVMGGCFTIILAFSIPLSIGLIVMLRRAYPLRPNVTAALGGLAAAAAAATLLVPFHPHDATAADLMTHLVVVMLVIGLNRLLGGRLLADRVRS
jgi:hypothetical protein